MKTPFFTVLIDTYNYGEYIEEVGARAGRQTSVGTLEILPTLD